MTREEHDKKLEELYKIAAKEKDIYAALEVLKQMAVRTLILGD